MICPESRGRQYRSKLRTGSKAFTGSGFAQGRTANTWQTQEENAALSDPQTQALKFETRASGAKVLQREREESLTGHTPPSFSSSALSKARHWEKERALRTRTQTGWLPPSCVCPVSSMPGFLTFSGHLYPAYGDSASFHDHVCMEMAQKRRM